jgi:hypothetical protein
MYGLKGDNGACYEVLKEVRSKTGETGQDETSEQEGRTYERTTLPVKRYAPSVETRGLFHMIGSKRILAQRAKGCGQDSIKRDAIVLSEIIELLKSKVFVQAHFKCISAHGPPMDGPLAFNVLNHRRMDWTRTTLAVGHVRHRNPKP